MFCRNVYKSTSATILYTIIWIYNTMFLKDGIHFGHVRMYATPYPTSWIIFWNQIVGIPMGTNCAPGLVADSFYTTVKEISWILLTITIKMIVSMLLIRLPGTSMTFWTFIILILKAQPIKFIHLNYSRIKLIPLIPKPHFRFTSFYCKWSCFI